MGKVLKEIKIGEWIIARKGRRSILAVGVIIKDYGYSKLFQDMEGWDLQHYVEVQWYIPNTPNNQIQFKKLPLGYKTLIGCKNDVVFQEIYKTDFSKSSVKFNVNDFHEPEEISPDELLNSLVDEGVRIKDAENIRDTIYRIIKLTEWYISNDYDSSESEIISFLTLPFLIALGWSEQKIKMEYNNIDIALFKESFRGVYSKDPYIIIEAKKFDNGLAFTDNQISKYSNLFPNCSKFVSTNGHIYKYYEKHNNELVQLGYFNLLKFTDRNVVFDIPFSSIQTIIEVSNYKAGYN